MAIGNINNLINTVYPVGSIYFSMNDTNPATLFGVGTWKRIAEGRTLIGVSSKYALGETGGEENHQLTVDEMPKHTHWVSLYTSGNYSGSQVVNKPGYILSTNGAQVSGGGSASFLRYSAGTEGDTGQTGASGKSQPHNNMQPYLAVFIWQRTA